MAAFINTEIQWNLTPYLISKSGLAIHGFDIHIYKVSECNQRKYRGKSA